MERGKMTKPEDEKNAIKEAIMKYYHQGHVESDPKLYDEILHDKWRFFFFDNKENLYIVNKKEYLSWYDPKKADNNLKWETEFYYVDVTENIGAAKIRLECQNVCYIDYFNLVKTQKKWWIVNKISHGIYKNQ
jgi:hypothetical protein